MESGQSDPKTDLISLDSHFVDKSISTIKEEDQNEPPETLWTITCKCFGLNRVRVANKESYFCNWWEFYPGMPIVIGIIVILTFLQFFFFLYPRSISSTVRKIDITLITFFGMMFIISYYRTVFTDPGFLPFNWSKTKRFSYTWQEQLSGMAISNEQIQYAKAHRAPGSSFSTSSGRFVVRADHYCVWISNWVGKRNHKFFLLFTFYGSIFALILLINQCLVKESLSKWKMILNFAACAIQILFGFFMLGMFCGSCYDLAHGRTQISAYKNEPVGQKSCLENTEEVCGTRSLICWILPTNPFPNGIDEVMQNTDLAPLQDE